jgi:hypothetical protein
LGTVNDVARLPIATTAVAAKAAARALWATADVELEDQALALNRRSEESWPDAPHRMTDQSFAMLDRMDREWHKSKRRRNSDALVAALSGLIPVWAVNHGTPFSLPVFVANRDVVLGQLRERRIFATALWPDSWLEAGLHPAAAWLAQHLVSLPLDERHDENDMERVAQAVTACARPPAIDLPSSLRPFVR